MIFNLVSYLKINLTDITFYPNGWRPDSEHDSVMVLQSGGDPNHWYDRTDWMMQIISRAENVNNAKSQIDDVYEELKNRYGLELPAVTVNSIVYPLVKTYQISPLQTPGYIGADKANLEMWSFNLRITTT